MYYKWISSLYLIIKVPTYVKKVSCLQIKRLLYRYHYSFFVGEYLNDLGLLVFSSASHQDEFDMI